MTDSPRRRTLLALLLALALLAPGLAAAPIARAANCVVTDNSDAGAASLRAALAQIGTFQGQDCATITFLPGLPTITLTSTLTISRPVAITGPGKDQLSIQGNNTFPLLFVNARAAPGVPGMDVALSGLTLTRGQAVGYFGGNLRSWRADLTLTGVALTNGTAAGESGGAGLAIAGGTVNLTGVTISGNSAAGHELYGTGAGISVEDSLGDTDVTITNSLIIGNTATSYGGGGILTFRTAFAAPRSSASPSTAPGWKATAPQRAVAVSKTKAR